MTGGVPIGLLKIERWRFNVLRAYFLTNQGLKRLGEFVRSDDSSNDQLFEKRNFIPFSRPFFCKRIVTVVYCSPLSAVFLQAVD